ncbi:hypothetical protein EQ500_04590, partial [Lactobacillus sp. XV13L]|nr:hypothetical protein [Lactobacillus sp. XV13L]
MLHKQINLHTDTKKFLKLHKKIGRLWLSFVALLLIGIIIVLGITLTSAREVKNSSAINTAFEQEVKKLNQPLKITSKGKTLHNATYLSPLNLLTRTQANSVQAGDFNLNGDYDIDNSNQYYVNLNWDSVPKTLDGYVVQRTTDPSLNKPNIS